MRSTYRAVAALCHKFADVLQAAEVWQCLASDERLQALLYATRGGADGVMAHTDEASG